MLLVKYSRNACSSQVADEQQSRVGRLFLPLTLQRRDGALIPFPWKGMGIPAPLVKSYYQRKKRVRPALVALVSFSDSMKK
jgi:hypothetical protein